MSWTTSFSSRVLQLSLIVASNISANQLQEVKENFSPIYTIMPANIEIHQRVLTVHLRFTFINENSECVSLR